MFWILILLLFFDERKFPFETETISILLLLLEIVFAKKLDGLRRIISLRTMDVRTCARRASTVMEPGLSQRYQTFPIQTIKWKLQQFYYFLYLGFEEVIWSTVAILLVGHLWSSVRQKLQTCYRLVPLMTYSDLIWFLTVNFGRKASSTPAVYTRLQNVQCWKRRNRKTVMTLKSKIDPNLINRWLPISVTWNYHRNCLYVVKIQKSSKMQFVWRALVIARYQQSFARKHMLRLK